MENMFIGIDDKELNLSEKDSDDIYTIGQEESGVFYVKNWGEYYRFKSFKDMLKYLKTSL